MKPGEILIAAAITLLVGCDAAPPADTAPTPPPPPVPMASGHRPAPEAALPAGHPPTDVVVGALAWTVPAGWAEETPGSTMRRAQYRVAPETTCVVFYFGPGQGGDARSNAVRWASQFVQPDGSDSASKMTIKEVAAGIPTQVVEVAGTYQDGMAFRGPPTPKPDHRLLAAIVEPSVSERWFFKLVGPDPEVEAARAGFEELIRSFRMESRDGS